MTDSSDERVVYREMGQASKEEDEEEEVVTAREAGPDLISSPGKLTAINLINVQQPIPPWSACIYVSRHEYEPLNCSAFQQRWWECLAAQEHSGKLRFSSKPAAVQQSSAGLPCKIRDSAFIYVEGKHQPGSSSQAGHKRPTDKIFLLCD